MQDLEDRVRLIRLLRYKSPGQKYDALHVLDCGHQTEGFDGVLVLDMVAFINDSTVNPKLFETLTEAFLSSQVIRNNVNQLVHLEGLFPVLDLLDLFGFDQSFEPLVELIDPNLLD